MSHNSYSTEVTDEDICATILGELKPLIQEIKTSLDGLTSNVSTLIEKVDRLNDSYTQLSTMRESELSNLASEITALNATVSTVLDTVSQHYSDSSTQTSSSEVNSSSCSHASSNDNMLAQLANNIHGNFSLALKNSYGFITNPPVYKCNGEGGWRRVFHLNMTNNNTQCPEAFNLTESPRRIYLWKREWWCSYL